jgi:hypothetical protein
MISGRELFIFDFFRQINPECEKQSDWHEGNTCAENGDPRRFDAAFALANSSGMEDNHPPVTAKDMPKDMPNASELDVKASDHTQLQSRRGDWYYSINTTR